jgi:hypothetical protein
VNLVEITIILMDKDLLTQHIIQAIKISNNEIELESYISSIRLENTFTDVIFNNFDKPNGQPENLQTCLNNFGKGQVWEFLWSKVSFLLLHQVELTYRDFERLCEIRTIDTDWWHSLNAFRAIVYYYSQTKDEEVFEYIIDVTRETEAYNKISLLALISSIKNENRVDVLFQEQIQELLEEESNANLLKVFYVYKYWYESNKALFSKTVYKLFDIVKIDYKIRTEVKRIYIDREEIISEQVEERFKSSLRAYALKLYLQIVKIDKEAQDYLSKWIDRECDVEIIDILKED